MQCFLGEKGCKGLIKTSEQNPSICSIKIDSANTVWSMLNIYQLPRAVYTGRSLPVKYRPLQTQPYKKGRPSTGSTDTDFQHVMDFLEERVND